MNREIKFRAWDKQNKEFIIFGPLFGLQNQTELPLDDGWFDVMQFTGLKDKNGKEIYERDIVRAESLLEDDDGAIINSVVGWDSFHATWSTQGFLWLWRVNKKCEVIGNIYENPELLKVKETNTTK